MIMRCCSNSVIFIVASLTFYESFGAQINLVSNNATLTVGRSAEFICTWQDTEEVGSNQVTWELPGWIHIFTYATEKNRTCANGTLIHRNSLGIAYRHTNWITDVRCLNGSALTLTINNITEEDNAIRISCKSQSASFHSTLYEFDLSKNHCTSQTCLNMGKCTNDVTSFHCKCLTGFKGPDCSKMRIWLPVTIGAAIVLLIILIIVVSIKVKMLLYPRLQGAVRSDSILSNVHTPYMELGSI